MFTGYHTEEHGFGNDDHYDYRLREGETIWEELDHTYGYRTGVFSKNPYLTSLPVGLRSAFHKTVSNISPPYRDAVDPRDFHEDGSTAYGNWLRECFTSGMPVRSLLNGVSIQVNSSPNIVSDSLFPDRFRPDDLVTLLLDWIDDQADHPWGACLNLMDAHTPYTPSEEFDKWGTREDWDFQDQVEHFRNDFTDGRYDPRELRKLENLYDGAILQADRKVKRLVTGLKRRGILDETFVIITSDHGEGFGEPSRIRPGEHAVGHSVGLHESQLHVPLVMRLPESTDGDNQEIYELATLTRLPTAIRNVVTDNGSPIDALVSKRPVATQIAGDERLHAVYEQRSGIIYKHMLGYTRDKTVEFAGTDTKEHPEIDTRSIVSEVIDEMRTPDVKERFSPEIDSDLEDRLADLGYR